MGTSRSSDAPQPLLGQRILVTRPAHQIRAAAEQLQARGAVPVPFSTIAIEPPPDRDAVQRAVGQLDRYDLVVFTSANAVDALWQEVERQGREAEVFGTAKVAAIGPATASALRERGVATDIVAKKFVAEQLAEAIVQELGEGVKGARALLPRALVARDVVPEALREAGLEVDIVAVYQTVPASQERAAELRELLRSGQVDIVMLTSGSTAEQLCNLLGPDAAQLLARVTVASIGPITTKTATQLGLDVAVTAESSTIGGLIDALEASLDPQRAG